MKNITTLVLMTLLSLGSLSCSGQSTSTNKKNEASTKEKKAKPIKLNKADFLTKVMNYETNSDAWNYLGDKPAISISMPTGVPLAVK